MNDFEAEPEELLESMLVAARRVLTSGRFILGDEVRKFEARWAHACGVEYGVGVGNGMDAIEIALRCVEIGPGDEVITTPHTFVATTEAIVSVGATPIFVDIDPDTHLINLDLLEQAITPYTRAIMFVDIYGQCPDMQRLSEIRDKYDLYIIEDAAHSLGNTFMGQPVGSFADITCFSFNPVKNLGAMGDAGCAVGQKILMDEMRMYRDHGRTGRYDIIEIGYNARIDNIQANVVLAKLPKLQSWLERKRTICAYYDRQLDGVVKSVKRQLGNSHSYYVYVIQTPRRDELRAFLENKGIGTNIHYATATHQQPAYMPWYRPCPVAEQTVNEILKSSSQAQCK